MAGGYLLRLPGMLKISLRLEDGRETLTMTLGEEFTASFSAEDIDALVARLGAKRALMAPRVPRECPATKAVAPEDPMWEIQRQRTHTMLRLRDPRFGWLRYGLSDPERLALAQGLTSVSPTQD